MATYMCIKRHAGDDRVKREAQGNGQREPDVVLPDTQGMHQSHAGADTKNHPARMGDTDEWTCPNVSTPTPTLDKTIVMGQSSRMPLIRSLPDVREPEPKSGPHLCCRPDGTAWTPTDPALND